MTVNNGGGDAEALRDDIRRTRAELGETVQALAARADVKARLKESAAQTRHRLGQQATQTAGLVRAEAGRRAVLARSSVHDASVAARRAPVPLAVLLVGAATAVVLVLVIRGRRG